MNKYADTYRGELEKLGFTLIELLGAAAASPGLGGLAGGIMAPEGHYVEGARRGTIQGLGAGLGLIPGAIGGFTLAGRFSLGNKKLELLKDLLLGGGTTVASAVGGSALAKKLMGKPSWEK